MIECDGWRTYSVWEHSRILAELYERRCRDEAEEMTCVAQAAELLAGGVRPGDTLLDVGCGSGWFYHAVRRRGIPVEYHGIDAAATFIEMGRRILPSFGLAPDRLHVMRLEDLRAEMDHVVCLNVLSNMDNFHRPLERILRSARRTAVLRESCKEAPEYHYVADRYLDDGAELRVHVNSYPLREWIKFIEDHGFDLEVHTDRRTQGQPEMIIGRPHHWKFFVARRRGA
jgi:ubiquinone/menaquinone biosynthesis C-methylase UbiE